MGLSNRTIKITYTAAGGTTFALPDVPLVSDSAETKVYLRDESTDPATVTLQTEGEFNDYTLTGAPLPGDFNTTVTFNVAPTTGFKVVIHLELPLTQLVDLTVSNGIPPSSLELALDRAVGQIQQINEIINRVPRLGITEQISAANMILPEPVGTELLGWNAGGTAITSYTPAEVVVASQGLVDTDALPEGATNLYFTNARADARADVRIAAADIADLADVVITSPVTNHVLTYSGGNWVNLPSTGSGGSSIEWFEDEEAPLLETANRQQVYSFIVGANHALYAEVTVPSGYIAGSQILLKGKMYSNASTNTYLMQTVATLIRANNDLVTSTTNQRTSTNAAITASGANQNTIQQVNFDLTSSIGQINSVAVAAGDTILVKLVRGSGTSNAAIQFLPKQCEVKVS